MPAQYAGLPGITLVTITPPDAEVDTSMPSHACDPLAAAGEFVLELPPSAEVTA